MLKNRTNEILVAAILVAPFVFIYGWMFVYPTIQMVQLSFTNAPLIGAGEWIGLAQLPAHVRRPRLLTSVWNTTYFVLLTVIPGTAVALSIALMVSAPQGLAAEPHPLGVLSALRAARDGGLPHLGLVAECAVRHPAAGHRAHCRTADQRLAHAPWFMPGVAVITIWWTNGFSILLFLAGLRNIPKELYEAAALDGATRWQMFTAHHLAADLAGHRALPDHPADPAAQDLRPGLSVRHGRPHRRTMVLVQYIYEQAFQKNYGRLRGHDRRRPVRDRRGLLAPPVPGAARERCTMTSPEMNPPRRRAQSRRFDLGGLLLTSLPSSARHSGSSRSIGPS